LNFDDYTDVLTFWTDSGNRQVINFPKAHYENGVLKHKNSNKWYKPVVRLFKNCCGSISCDKTPSYFLECMIFNVPNSNFNIINSLNKANLDNFICQNSQLKLFRTTP